MAWAMMPSANNQTSVTGISALKRAPWRGQTICPSAMAYDSPPLRATAIMRSPAATGVGGAFVYLGFGSCIDPIHRRAHIMPVRRRASSDIIV